MSIGFTVPNSVLPTISIILDLVVKSADNCHLLQEDIRNVIGWYRENLLTEQKKVFSNVHFKT